MRKVFTIVSSSLLTSAIAISALPVNKSAAVNAQEKKLTPVTPVYYENEVKEDKNQTEKTETVYTFMDNDGKVTKTLVSAWLHDDDGISNITETLSLSDVTNVKSDDEPIVSANSYTWNTDGNDIYYQGESALKAPVQISVTYELDGKKVKAADLQGKSGHLKVTYKLTNTQSKKVTADGKEITIHPAYLTAGFLVLDNDVFSNVSCNGSKTINDGNKEVLAFARIPGLTDTLDSAGLQEVSEKLDLSNDVVIEAEVKNYSAPTVYFGATNEVSFDELEDLTGTEDLDELFDEITPMFDASKELDEGAAALADGAKTLADGVVPLSNSTSQMDTLATGIDQLNTGGNSLKEGITTYTAGVEALNTGNQHLYQISDALGQIESATSEAGALGSGAKTLASSLSYVDSELQAVDVQALLTKLTPMLTQAQTALAGLDQVMEKDAAVLATLSDTLDTAITQSSAMAAAIEGSATSIGAALQADAYKIAVYNAQASAASAQIAAAKQQAQANLAQAQSDLAVFQQTYPDADTSAIVNSVSAAQAAVDAIPDYVQLDQLQGISQSDLQTLQAALQGLQSMKEQIGTAQAAMESLKTDLQTSQATLSALKSQLEGLTLDSDIQSLVEKVNQLKSGISQLSAGAGSLSDGITQLDSALVQVQTSSKDAFDQINAGSGQLAANSSALNEGAASLQDGLTQLSSAKTSINELKSGITEVVDAINQLSEGSDTLASGMDQFEKEAMEVLADKLNLGKEKTKALETVWEEIVNYTEETSNFAGAPEGAKTSVRYIYKFGSSSTEEAEIVIKTED